MKQFSLLISIITIFAACNMKKTDTTAETKNVNAVLDSLNATAARADFNNYFKLYAEDGIFTGTDATERWDKNAFMAYAKPHFDKGKAWSFTSMERHVYFDASGKTAWFDELLNTQMKICRGSGVLVKVGEDWKIKQYILTATIPNETMDSALKIKTPIEDGIIKKILQK